MNRDELARLSKDELIELVLQLQRPAKTSRTSSKPPSTDRKARREQAKPGGAKPGHKGHFRALAEAPDTAEDHFPDQCPHCQTALDAQAPSVVIQEYDEIDLPEIRPRVHRHRRFAITCPHCQAPVKAAPVATGTPFGPRLHALAVYLKTFQALSFQRLQRLLSDLCGLAISQGTLANMLHRAHAPFHAAKADIVERLRRARVVASDETGLRIEGVNAWHWVFRSSAAVVHEPAFSRGAQVVRDVMADHKPAVWVSDRYSAQQNHGHRHQTCLAHLARDVAYGLDGSDDALPFRLKLWLDKVFALATSIATIAPSTLAAKRKALERSLAEILEMTVSCDIARALQTKFAKAREQLLTFCDFSGDVEVTNNACERSLRPSVIQRKVTNGFRAQWAAKGEAAVRTVVDTARLHGASAFKSIQATIA